MTPERAEGLKLAEQRLSCRNDSQTGQHLTESEVDKVCLALHVSEAEHAVKDGEIRRLREAIVGLRHDRECDKYNCKCSICGMLPSHPQHRQSCTGNKGRS